VDIRETHREEIYILHLAGQLDTEGAYALAHYLAALQQVEPVRVIVNVKELSYLNSSGLRVLLQAENALRARGGHLAVCAATGLVKRVMTLVGIDKVLRVYETETEALQQVAGEHPALTPCPFLLGCM
jgi:anti-anti-sigma factor